MMAKELIHLISELNPDEETDIEFLIMDSDAGIYDFLDVINVVSNADCSGINSIGINLKLSHSLDI